MPAPCWRNRSAKTCSAVTPEAIECESRSTSCPRVPAREPHPTNRAGAHDAKQIATGDASVSTPSIGALLFQSPLAVAERGAACGTGVKDRHAENDECSLPRSSHPDLPVVRAKYREARGRQLY